MNVAEIDGLPMPSHRFIVGQRVDATSYADATARVVAWAANRQSRYLCASNVHMVMHGYDVPAFREVVNAADLITPDGMPLVWGLRALGVESASRVYGPTLALKVCEAAAREGLPVGLYGGTGESLDGFARTLRERCPGLQIACSISPPFRPLTPEEDAAYTAEIADSGARILLVGLGCPKQECWMAAHKEKLPMPMLGVGAAFDFHSGRVRQAPSVLQKCGLEWLFRLVVEPRRLWRRYVLHNPRFVVFFALQLLRARSTDGVGAAS